MAAPELRSSFFNSTLNYKFVTGEGEHWSKSLARQVMDLHNGVNRHDHRGNPLPDTGTPPRLIFFTATSAIPFGYATQTCWQEAFPGDHPPFQAVIDVSNNRFGHKGFNRILRLMTPDEMESIRQDQIKTYHKWGKLLYAHDNVAVFDEWISHYPSGTFDRAADILGDAGFTDVNFVGADLELPEHEEKTIIRRGDIHTPYRTLTTQMTQKSAVLVDDMKKLGKAMAEQIKIHIRGIG